MVNPPVSQAFPSTESKFITSRPPLSRTRTRTSSIFSTCSGISFKSAFEVSKGPTTVFVSQRPEKHEAYGSFIPLRSATSSLKSFVSDPSSYVSQFPPKRRRTTSYNIRTSLASSWEDPDAPPSPGVPYITRTLPSSPIFPSSPSSSRHSLNTRSDLHPILAKLERKSRLCTKTVHCSTCRKTGTDFPRCGKCGEMWCSRSCRLVGGKRHACAT
ncbi:hypothetical protein B0H34DRAFT_453278 [Crassisporium funariophilum]|nr:hypothetical protein B0H34DRAFT_453278 [Crassisporium funariophilum]